MAEAYISRLGELAIQVESAKGVTEMPLVNGDESKLFVYDLAWSDDVRQFDRRAFAKSTSRYRHLVGQTVATISGRIELRKSAVTGTEDAWGPLLRAAGLKFTSGTGAYTKTTDLTQHPTLTALCWIGSTGASGASIRCGIRGAVCSRLILSHRIGEPPMIEFTLIGVHDPADDDLKEQADALNTITHEDAIPGVWNAVSGVELDDVSAALYMSSFSVDLGPQAVERQDATATSGIAYFVVVDHDMTVTLDPEKAQPSVAYWRAKLRAAGVAKLELTHNQPATTSPTHTAATFDYLFPVAQVQSAEEADRNGIATLAVTLKPCLSAEPGDDEFKLTITKAAP